MGLQLFIKDCLIRPEDENAETGFRWSLTLVAKILVRTIMEGAASDYD